MTATLRAGRYVARIAQTEADLDRAQVLRHRCFVERAGLAPRPDGRDRDAHDALCRHVLIEEGEGGRLAACFRVLVMLNGQALAQSYAASSYDLSALARYERPILELGRFCIAPTHHDADVLRVAWGALAGLVAAEGVAMLIGCASFAVADPALHRAALSHLGARHLGPVEWRPGRRAAEVVDLRPLEPVAPVEGLRALPPLLRSYLGMGGWVGDHAVIDRDMDTLHVFMALEVAAIPAGRARALRQIAGASGGDI